jgi:hypothetical protein
VYFPVGNNEISEDDIINWLNEGWRFRSKRSKGRYYITRRKKNKEKSLGPYNQELWNTIQRLNLRAGFKKTITNDNFQIQLNKYDELKIIEKTRYNLLSCLFRDDENHCRYYTYENKREGMNKLDEMDMSEFYDFIDIDVNGKREKKYVYYATSSYCKNCSTFLNKKMIGTILNYSKII